MQGPRIFVEYAGPLTSGLLRREDCWRYRRPLQGRTKRTPVGETTKDVRCLFGIYDDLSTKEEN